MTLIKSVGTVNRQSSPIPRKFVTLYHRTTKIRMLSDKRDKHDEYDYEINEDKIITLKYTACAVAKRRRDSYMNIPHFIFILLGYVTNRPFLSYLGPLYQNEVKCSAFDKEMIFHYHANKNSFSQERLCTWPHFESEGFWNSKVAYSEFIDQLPVGLLA